MLGARVLNPRAVALAAHAFARRPYGDRACHRRDVAHVGAPTAPGHTPCTYPATALHPLALTRAKGRPFSSGRARAPLEHLARASCFAGPSRRGRALLRRSVSMRAPAEATHIYLAHLDNT